MPFNPSDFNFDIFYDGKSRKQILQEIQEEKSAKGSLQQLQEAIRKADSRFNYKTKAIYVDDEKAPSVFPDPSPGQRPLVVPPKPPADPDRPTLADRLDKAEGEIQELRRVLECKDSIIASMRQDCQDALAESRVYFGRMERAEAIARKVDLMGADLERCKEALGTIAFDKILRGEKI